MKIELVLQVEDPNDIDPSSDTGITSNAYGMLTDALADVGMGILSGPTKVQED